MLPDISSYSKEFGPRLGNKEMYLKESIQLQVNRLIGLDFHSLVHKKYPKDERERRYRKDFTLPQTIFFPPGFEENTIPLVVEPRKEVGIEIQAAKDLIKDFVVVASVKDIVKNPVKPYLIFVVRERLYNAQFSPGKTSFLPFETEGTLLQKVSLHHHLPEVFHRRSVYAPGSKVGDNMPHLSYFHGFPEIHVNALGASEQNNRAITRYQNIIELGF